MEEKKSELNLSLNRVWEKTAALTDVSRSTTKKIVERRRRHRTSSNSQKKTPSSTLKVSVNDFDQGVVRRTIASMFS